MKLQEILTKYSDAAIDQIAADKVDESANLRLPRNVIVQEIISALSSLTYVAAALAPAKPPTYAFIKLLLEASDYSVPIEGFQEKVIFATKEMTQKAESGNGLSVDKNYQLYINILNSAWESDNIIDRSEAMLLEALRNELGIWAREHFLLEHHPQVRKFWDSSGAYISARNHLLVTGLVLTNDNKYLLADEVVIQLRRALGIDLEEKDYIRLLEKIKKEQLHNILEKLSLQVSGTKEELSRRIIDVLIPPAEFLDNLQKEELRDLCRETGIQISGKKVEVINNIIDFFDNELDLVKKEEDKPVLLLPAKPEPRELSNLEFTKLLQYLTTDELHDILSKSFLRTSGIKDEKITRLVESPWSELSMLNCLRKIDLSDLCKKMGIHISGIKNEIIERLIEGASFRFSDSTAKAVLEDQEMSIEAKSISNKEKIADISEIVEIKTVQLPKNLRNIKVEFPDLNLDEQIVLALISETRSLTEYDIHRASKHHNLGWFLTKAHMSELAAKLKKNGGSPLHIRSIRSVNIYEWINKDNLNQNTIDSRTAKDVIDALRQGVVPEKNLDLLMIGQTKARTHLKELLNETKNNKSPFKFIRGPYGAGKTFLSSWLREYAINNEFVVSTVNIGPDQPLSDLPVFYSGLINGLRIPEKKDSSALNDILESWLLSIHRKTAQIEGLTDLDSSTHKKLSHIVEKRVDSELAFLSDLDPGFAPALRAFYRAKNSGDQVLASTAISWLSGSRSMSGRILSEIGIKGYLESNQVFPRIRALLELIKGSRYQGLLLIIDELELIRKFPHSRQREQAFEILRLLIDESGKNGFPGCLLIFTGTDTFFEDDRTGLKSYEALASRISVPNNPDGLISMRQPVITLQGLDHTKLNAVIERVRNIHGIAYNWNSKERLPREALDKLVKDWTAFGNDTVNRKPRPIIREFINILDLCEENPNISYNELIQVDSNEKDVYKEITDTLNQ